MGQVRHRAVVSSRSRNGKILAVVVVALAVLATLSGAANGAPFNTSPPFKQCPAVGQSPSCQVLLMINPDKTISVLKDPSVGTYDGSDDTLVGIVNNSGATVSAVTVSGVGSDLGGLDGDGICTFPLAGCPFGTTGYEGPGTALKTDPASPDAAEVDFTGGGLRADATTYFSLEGDLATATITARQGTLTNTPTGTPNNVWSGYTLRDNAKAGSMTARATFTVPVVPTCQKGKDASVNAWAGVDGHDVFALLQGGWFYICRSGKAVNSYFWENFTRNAGITGPRAMPAAPAPQTGDVVEASVCPISGALARVQADGVDQAGGDACEHFAPASDRLSQQIATWDVRLVVKRGGKVAYHHNVFVDNYTPLAKLAGTTPGSIADCILERTQSDGPQPGLTNFGTVNMSCEAASRGTGSVDSRSLSVDPAASGYTSTRYDIWAYDYTKKPPVPTHPLATITPLGKQGNAYAFSDTWQAGS